MESTTDDSRIMKMQLVHLSIPVTDMDFMDKSIHSFKINQINEKIYDIEVIYFPNIRIWQEHGKVNTISTKGKNKTGDVIISQQFSDITEMTRGIMHNGIETTMLRITYKCSMVYED